LQNLEDFVRITMLKPSFGGLGGQKIKSQHDFYSKIHHFKIPEQQIYFVSSLFEF